MKRPIVTRDDLDAVDEVKEELAGARFDYPPMKSAHEGIAVIREEYDELWDEVKKKPSAVSKQKMREEAKQLAAMAIRFMVDVCAS